MSNFLKFTEMKLRTILFATVAMTIVVVGCSKQEVTTPSKEYNVEFNVAGKGGFDAATKAVKTGWEAGDQIAIFCQPGATGNYLADNSKIIYLNYDGTSWSSSKVSSALVAELGASGKFSAIHYRVAAGKNISLDGIGTLATYIGGVILSSFGEYVVASDVLTLGEILMTFDDTPYATGQQVQVSVKGLNEDGVWQMTVGDNTYTPSATRPSSYALTSHQENGFRFSESSGHIGTWGGRDEYSLGLKTGGDLSFIVCGYTSNTKSDANDKYHFYLTNGTDVYTYTVDRGEHNGSKYAKNLEIGHAYLLPAITEAGKWVKQQ